MTFVPFDHAGFRHQSFLDLRPISVATQLFGISCWVLARAVTPDTYHFNPLQTMLLSFCMLLGTFISWRAKCYVHLLVGILFNVTALSCGFRISCMVTPDPALLLLPAAVCITLTCAPIVNETLPFLLACTIIWGVLDHDLLQLMNPRMEPLWMLVLVAASLISALLVHVLFRRLRKHEFQLRQELKALAFQDALTGIDNRRSLLEKLQVQYRLHPGYFLMVDVDDFKRVNDRFGHDAGDAALQDVAAVLAAHPDTCLCGRLGGEEFGVFTLHTRPAKVEAMAQALLDEVNQCTVRGERLSISIGIARMDQHSGLASTMQKADAALYEAKRSGKNRYVIAPPDSKVLMKHHAWQNPDAKTKPP